MSSNSFELESKKLLEFMHERKQIESSVLILLVKKRQKKKKELRLRNFASLLLMLNMQMKFKAIWNYY